MDFPDEDPLDTVSVKFLHRCVKEFLDSGFLEIMKTKALGMDRRSASFAPLEALAGAHLATLKECYFTDQSASLIPALTRKLALYVKLYEKENSVHEKKPLKRWIDPSIVEKSPEVISTHTAM